MTREKSRKKKVFCIGLSKTGTTSLSKALEILGYRSIHTPIIYKNSSLTVEIKWQINRVVIHFSKKLEFGFTDKLVTSGPYRYIRNPIYVADVLIALGIAFLVNSLHLHIVLVIFSIMMLLIPIIEEPWLLKQYGANYISYCAKVPRFVPSFNVK